MHLLVIFAIAVFVFGPKKLPELGKGLGEAIRGFKDSLKTGEATPPTQPPGSTANSHAKGDLLEKPPAARRSDNGRTSRSSRFWA
jgi:sec-independent protein translocase protein TatA